MASPLRRLGEAVGDWDLPARVGGRFERATSRLPAPARRVVGRLRDREVVLAGSSLAFYGMISAIPLLLIALAVVRVVFGNDALDQLGDEAGRSSAQGAGRLVRDLADAARTPNWWVYVVALWPATAYAGGLRRALREASGHDEPLPGLKGRALGLLLVPVLPLLVVGGVPLTFALSRLGGQGTAGTLGSLVAAVAGGAIVGAVLLSLVYQTFAPEGLAWLATAKVASGVATTIALMSLAFVEYLRVGQFEQRYGNGAVSLGILFGVWLLAANVLLLAGYQGILEIDETSGAAEGD